MSNFTKWVRQEQCCNALTPRVLCLLFFAALFLFSTFFAACSAFTKMNQTSNKTENKTIMLTIADNEKEITANLGGTLEIELERAGSTGYDWHLDEKYREYLLLLSVEDRHKTVKKGVLGAPMIKIWQFQTIKIGEADIVIRLYRNWEGREKTASTFTLNLNIK